MAVSDEHLKEIADMNAGRAPAFTEQAAVDAATKPFSSSTGMIKTAGAKGAGIAVKTVVEVLLRENPAFRTGRGSIDVFDAATTYTVTIDGNAHAEVGVTDIETTVDNLVVDVNGGDPGAHGVPETEFGDTEFEITAYDATTTYDLILESITTSSGGVVDEAGTAAALKALLEADERLTKKFSFAISSATITVTNKTAESYTADALDTTGSGTIVFRAVPVRASREGSGTASKLLLKATHPNVVTMVATQASGTGRWSLAKDATAVTFAIWGLNTGRTYPVVLSGKPVAITELKGPWAERLDTAGLTFVGVEIRITDGLVRWAIGPADLE